MFLIRQARPADLPILLKLARMVHFINLPADKDVIAERIRRSRASFDGARTGQPETNGGAGDAGLLDGRTPVFMFVMEESSTGNALGTSSVIARMGTPGNPNIGMQLRRRELFSTDLQQGVTHVTAQVFLDEDGPTEIGGLIVGPSYRGHPLKLGMQLSLVRFHYIGLHRQRFQDRLLAEMMAPLTPDGGNTLWEYLGRRFINLTYAEADRFCAYSREFMMSLLPREEIYLTLLPPEARALIGQVGPETKPARAMLEKLGFAYHDRIDPFDGGPHLEAATDAIQMVRDTRRAPVAGVCEESETTHIGFVSVDGARVGEGEPEFRALYTGYRDAQGGGVLLPEAALGALGCERGDSVGLTPMPTGRKPTRAAGSRDAARSARSSKGGAKTQTARKARS